ncbi:MAG: DUF3560 domain-containing protein [Polyangiaceae bacterium]|nr:DUF3560 domain-containing protein [Polyangiaceae bacterium]
MRTQSGVSGREQPGSEEAKILAVLDTALHPYYHTIKTLPIFTDLVLHGRTTPVDAVTQLAFQNPEAALAAFESALLAEAERIENDAGQAKRVRVSNATQSTQRRSRPEPSDVDVEPAPETRRAPWSSQVQKPTSELTPTPPATILRSEFGDAVLTPTATRLEFQFPEMPHREVLDALREAGFRWDGATRKWWAQRSALREKRAPTILDLHSQKARDAAKYKKGRSKKPPVEPSPAQGKSETPAVVAPVSVAEPYRATERSPHGVEKTAPPPVEPTQSDSRSDILTRVQKLREFANDLEGRALHRRDFLKVRTGRTPLQSWPEPAISDKERRLREALVGSDLEIAEALQEASDLHCWADIISSNQSLDPDDSNAVAELSAEVQRGMNHVAALKEADATRWVPSQGARTIQDAERSLDWHERRFDELTDRDATRSRAPRALADAQMVDDIQNNRIEIRFERAPPERMELRLVYNRFRPNSDGMIWRSSRDNRAWWAGLRILKGLLPTMPVAPSQEVKPASTVERFTNAVPPAHPVEPQAPSDSEASRATSVSADPLETSDTEESDESETGESPKSLNWYEAKKAARIEGLQARAEKYGEQSQRVTAEARRRADVIPLGQPILVGHHSEGRDRRYRERIRGLYDKGFQLGKKAEHYAHRASAAEKNDAVSSDDPDAIAKIQAKVAALQTQVERWKKINKVIQSARRRHKEGWEPIAITGLKEIGISASIAEKLVQKDLLGRYGIADYQFKNTGAEIRRLKKRIADIQARDNEAYRAPVRIGDAEVSEDREENRVRIVFDEIPAEEVRKKLRYHGFIWAPSVGAWQRAYSSWHRQEAERLVGEIFGVEKEAADGLGSADTVLAYNNDDNQ